VFRVRTGDGRRAGCLGLCAALLIGLLPMLAWAEWVGLSPVTVSKVSRTSATFTASITTDARGSGTLVPGFFVRVAGQNAGFVLASGSPASVPAAGNATTTYSTTATGLECGRKYEVSARYVKDPDANGIGTASSNDPRLTTFTTWSCTVPELSDLEALRYIASHPDLIAAFGTDGEKGRRHYLDWGFAEGRKLVFEPLNYTASHPDLITAFGADEFRAVRHFIEWGSREGRRTVWTDLDSLRYIASYPDLIEAFGADRVKGVRHYIERGYAEGRRITFSELDALRYVATHPDLILALGNSIEGALRHFIASGYREGRKIEFEPSAYLAVATNADLKAVFGADLAAVTVHYINFGFREGRQRSASLRPPALALNATEIVFGKQEVGSTVTREVTIRNTGEDTLLLESVRLVAGASNEFSSRATCGALLRPGDSCAVSVSFKPIDRGVESTTLSIAHNAAGRVTSLPVSAQGIAPVVVASATSLDFGTQAVNTESGVRRVTLVNEGDAPWVFDAHYLEADSSSFSSFVTGSNCSGRYGLVQPGENCFFDVRFTPKRAGTFVATVHTGPARVPGDSVLLRGVATGPGYELSPSLLSFPDQPSGSSGPPRNFLISNPGDAPLKVSQITLIGKDAAQFWLSHACSEIPAGGRCAVAVTFKPDSVGGKSAQLRVQHNSPLSTEGSGTADIAATAGDAAALLALAPRSLEFAAQPLNTSSAVQKVRVTNRGSKPLVIGSISLVADDPEEFSRTHDCNSPLEPEASCEISVVFRPVSAGARSARLSIANDAKDSPAFVAVSGMGGGSSTNELVCGSSLTSFADGTLPTDADLDVRNTPDGKGFLVRFPAWREYYALRGRTSGVELMISRDTPRYAARQISLLECPTIRLIDADNFDGKPEPCDVDVGDVLAAPADTLFRFAVNRWQNSPTPASTMRYVTRVRLGQASLVPPVFSGDAGNGQITLRWAAVAGATAYRVVRFVGDGTETLVERTTDLSATLAAANDQTLSYAVRAINDQHESGLSNPVRLTPGSSPATTIAIDEIQVMQSIQSAADGSVPLIAGKPGIVRVHFSVSGSSDGKAGIVRLSKAGETPIDIRGPILDSPSASTAAASCVATFDLRDAASRWFPRGEVDLTVEVDHGDSLSASSTTRKQRSRKFNFVAQKPIHVKLVPVTTDFGTPSDAEMTESKAEIGALLNAMYPNASVYIETAETALAWGSAIRPFAINDWGRALEALGSMRSAELSNRNCDRFYYGVFKNVSVKKMLREYLGIGGLATYPSESSLFGCPPLYGIGVLHDSFDLSSRGIAAHEIGHLHRLEHVSTADETNDVCGDAPANDRNYPHAKGRIGVTGYDARRHQMLQSTLQHDFMGYCRRSWISDYHYKKLRNFQELLFDSQAVVGAGDRETVAAADAEPSRGVLLTGLVRAGPEQWEIASVLRLDGTRAPGEAAATLEAEAYFGDGILRRYPVVINDLDHVTAKLFEVWIPGDAAPWRVIIRRRSGEVVLDWNSGRSEARADFESLQAAAVAARTAEAGVWVLDPWTWGPRMLIRVRDDVRTFVGNDDGTTSARFEAQAGDEIEVLATRLGTRVKIVLGTAEEMLGSPSVAAPSLALAPVPALVPVPASEGPATANGSSVGAATAATSTKGGARDEPRHSEVPAATTVDAAGSSYRLFRRDEADGRQSWRLDYLDSGEQRIATRELAANAAVVWRGSGQPGAFAKSLPSSGWVLVCGTSVWAVRDGYSLDIDRATGALGASVQFQRNVDAAGAEALLVSTAECSAGGGLTVTGYSVPVDELNPSAIAATTPALAFALSLWRDGAIERLDTRPAMLDLDQLCAAPMAGGRRKFCEGLRELRAR